MKRLGHLLAIAVVMSMMSCGEEDVPPTVDLDEVWEQDLQTINDYIEENDLSPVDTTVSGARFIIQEFGDSTGLAHNDIVTVDYIASDINGIIYRTTIQEVADTVFSNFPTVEPWTFTYTESGWTFEFTAEVAELQGEGLKEALVAALPQLTIGGHVTILLPSALGFGSGNDPSNIIPNFSVLVYEVYLKQVR